MTSPSTESVFFSFKKERYAHRLQTDHLPSGGGLSSTECWHADRGPIKPEPGLVGGGGLHGAGWQRVSVSIKHLRQPPACVAACMWLYLTGTEGVFADARVLPHARTRV